MEKFVYRVQYLDKIREFIDKPVIKVITGMRRCGKSVLLRQIRDELKSKVKNEKALIYLNFESQNPETGTAAENLYQYISKLAKKVKWRLYILLDEIQLIKNWERHVESLRVDFNCDIFITGSNAMLLAGELSTLLAGRYVEIPVYPLSFSEYLEFTKEFNEDSGKDTAAQFLEYMKFGGLPGVHEMDINSKAVEPYLLDIYHSVLLKDVVARHGIRDTELLERIIAFLMDNLGNIFSAKSISNFLKNQGRRLSTETVYNYLDALREAFLINKVSRYDIIGKRRLETREKYFLEDTGIKYAVHGYRAGDINGLLENIVFMELKRSGWSVSIGQMPQGEIDFIAERRGEKIYVQVAYLLPDQSVIDREFGPLKKIPDNYPKYVLSMDPTEAFSEEGIQRIPIIDFLKKLPPFQP